MRSTEKVAFALNFGGGVARNDAFCGERFRNGQFDIQPALVFVLVFPDPAHSRTCVARNHSKV